ncbi:oligosaccharide flippase family protein [Microbacterium sp. KUDC0406]|uniref:oligosaccharide flippase family protein n=1 Tax=Microbacterium sp. KUDC0406 TaxID=2909588 RepID=UPI001F405AB4|nr:oligosaccharide flippase family protein [Microbacterium sp. KUDC0406]UJP08886.1 oligosaccharide flippase family protein [Microbacterium sp. KUDC0406]
MSDEEAVEHTASVGQRTAAGVIWLTVQKWITRLSGFATIAILTRLIAPAEFGTVAAASTLLPFFYLLSDFGFATYIVQAGNVTRRTTSTGFWFSIVVGVVLSGLLALSAPVAGVMFGSDDVVPVVRALAIVIPLVALASVPTALLRRRMQFKALAAQGAAAAVIAQVVAVVMAFAGFGVWALVGQTLCNQIVVAAAALWVARWRRTGHSPGRSSAGCSDSARRCSPSNSWPWCELLRRRRSSLTVSV